MSEKPKLEESTQPPVCPHCKYQLHRLHWHKVDGDPGTISYLALISCPHCRAMLGAAAS